MTSSRVDVDLTRSFLCADYKWDDNWNTPQFTLKPLYDEEDCRWKDFSGKTFVRIKEALAPRFKKMIDNFDCEPIDPEKHVQIDNSSLAFTGHAIFIGFHHNSGDKDVVLRIDKYDKDYNEIIEGIDRFDHNSNIIICTTSDGKQYLGFDEMNLFIDIDKMLEDKKVGRPTEVNNVKIDTKFIKILDFNDTFAELFS